MALVKCKECGTKFSDKAKACTKCGLPPAKKTSIVTWLVAIILGFWLIGIISNQGSSEAPKPAQSAYPSERNLDYRAAALGQLKEGTLLTFTGKVLQVVGNDGLRLATKQEEHTGYFGDDVYLSFDSKPQVLDDEIIKVMGRYDGTLKYETVLSSERVVPKIRVDYFTVLISR